MSWEWRPLESAALRCGFYRAQVCSQTLQVMETPVGSLTFIYGAWFPDFLVFSTQPRPRGRGADEKPCSPVHYLDLHTEGCCPHLKPNIRNVVEQRVSV